LQSPQRGESLKYVTDFYIS